VNDNPFAGPFAKHPRSALELLDTVPESLLRRLKQYSGRLATEAVSAMQDRLPFFADLGPSAIADVTHMLRTIDLPARSVIIRKGQQGDCMYFVASGEVEVDLPGRKVQLGEGAFFGEMALLGNNLRSANITTTQVSRLLVLDLVDFRLLMARHPDLAETIDAEASRRALENK